MSSLQEKWQKFVHSGKQATVSTALFFTSVGISTLPVIDNDAQRQKVENIAGLSLMGGSVLLSLAGLHEHRRKRKADTPKP